MEMMRKEQAHTLFPGLNLAGAPGCLQHWPPGASPQGSSLCLQPVSHTHHPGTGSPSRAPSPLSLTRQPLLLCPPDALLTPCFTHFFSWHILLTFQGSDVRRKQCPTPSAIKPSWPPGRVVALFTGHCLPGLTPQTRSRNCSVSP